MIGQDNLISVIETQIENNRFPRFSIILGAEGSGKKTLTWEISKRLDVQRAFIEPKIDAVREMIQNAYKVTEPVMYVVLDTDLMSIAGKNALLKVCEETPNNAYIVMLATDKSNVLDTLLSRASVYSIESYTVEQIIQYAGKTEDTDIIIDLCETPGDVDKLKSIGASKFYEYVEKVVDYVAETSVANALKITDSLDVKNNDDKKYDVILFLKAFQSICGKRMRQAVIDKDGGERKKYSNGVKIVSDTLKTARIKGVNRSAVIDLFILNIRERWC